MIKKSLREQAEALDTLLPRLMRELCPSTDEDPLAALPLAQLRVMRMLFDGPRAVGEVAAELHLSASSTSQLAHRLADAGFLQKADDPEDRRGRMLSLTPHGRSAMETRREQRVTRLEELLSRADESTRCALVKGLSSLLKGPHTPESLQTTAGLEKGISI